MFTTAAVSQAEYARAADAKTIDYDSFTVQESASTAERTPKYLSFEEYLERLMRRILIQQGTQRDYQYTSTRHLDDKDWLCLLYLMFSPQSVTTIIRLL